MNDQTPQDPVTPFSGTALVERPGRTGQASRADAPRPEAARPAAAAPDTVRPDATRPAAAAPDAARVAADAARADGLRPSDPLKPSDLLAPDPDPSTTRPTPTRIGRYRILEPLAEGGMARVYIAQRDGADGICVLKQLLVDLESNDVAAKRFRREAHVASFLLHENVARVTDAGEEEGSFYIAMDYIEGKDIESMSHEMLRRQRLLPYPVTLTAICGILEGLAYAHRAHDPSGEWMQVVHRDLSPRNMMLTYDGVAKVIDFGMAKGNFDSFKTSPGMVLGTLRFVSPEQATAQQVDARSDLYSVAVVLQELLTGHMVVKPGKPFEMMKAVVHEKVPPLSSLNPTLPAALDDVIARGLAKHRDDRYASAEEFRAALIAAAPEWCHTPGDLLGEFMREQFPDEVARATHFLSLGASGAEPSFDGAQKTRTVMARDLRAPVRPKADDDDDWVRPVTMVTGEVALTTRTGMVFPELTKTAGGQPTVVLREPDLLDTAPEDLPRIIERAAPLRDSLPPQPVTAQMSVPPTQVMPAPRAGPPARDRWGEVRGSLITAAVFIAGIIVWRILSAPPAVVVVEPPPPAPTVGASATARPVVTPAIPASPAASAASPPPSSVQPARETARPLVPRESARATAAPRETPRAPSPLALEARALRDRLRNGDDFDAICKAAEGVAAKVDADKFSGDLTAASFTGDRAALDKILGEIEKRAD